MKQAEPMSRDVRNKLILIGIGTLASLVVLYFAKLFYLQLILTVGGVAVIFTFALLDREPPRASAVRPPGEYLDRLETNQRLQRINQMLTEEQDESEKRDLRGRKNSHEREARLSSWARRDSQLEIAMSSEVTSGLTPIPTSPRGKKDFDGSRHLLDALDEAVILAKSEPADSARAQLSMIANDIRAHYRVLKETGNQADNLVDYVISWTTLSLIAQGSPVEPNSTKRASRRVRHRLGRLLDLVSGKTKFSD